MDSRPLLELVGLSKRFGTSVAADDFGLEVVRGELVTILGGSGAGKSTILKMVAGLVPPDSGKVIFAGADVTNYPAHKLPFSMVFQSDALFPHLTVRKNLSFPLDRMRHFSREQIATKVKEMCILLGIDDLQSRLPGLLSGGEKRRVALGRALLKVVNIQAAKDAALLLMDEPFSGLDRNLREAMQMEVKKLQQLLALTILYVTHDQVEAMSISERVGIIRQGSLVQIGKPTEIYESPANTYVAGFLGLSNMIRGELQGDRTTITLPDGNKIQTQRNHETVGPVNILVHGERIHFSPNEEVESNSIEVTLVLSRFQGSSIVFTAKTAWGSDLSIIRSNAAGEAAPELGSRMKIYWDIRNTKLVPT